jgi:hypothetical protein
MGEEVMNNNKEASLVHSMSPSLGSLPPARKPQGARRGRRAYMVMSPGWNRPVPRVPSWDTKERRFHIRSSR